MKTLAHTLRRSHCVKESVWENGSLCCPCGEILALRYVIDGTARIYIYPEYRKYRAEIIEGQRALSGTNAIGALCFDDVHSFFSALPKLDTSIPEEPVDEETENDKEDT